MVIYFDSPRWDFVEALQVFSTFETDGSGE
jgi:hypothetical protein